MQIAIGMVFLLIFVGCSHAPSGFFQEKIRTVAPQSKIPTQETVLVKTHHAQGYIKGIIRSVTQEGASGLWHYEVEGTDTSNFKLPHARFTHTAFLARVGALVYVQIEKGKLVQLYSLEGASTVQKPQNPSKPLKRTLKRQVLSVPQSETITLE